MYFTLVNISDVLFDLHPGDRIFLQGDLGAGKTTFAGALLRRHFHDSELLVTSPTFTYYQTYPDNIYHFDLYRIEHREDIVRIGAHEIFDDPESICIIEWPDRLSGIINPTKIVDIIVVGEGREIQIRECQEPCIDKV